MADTTVSTLTPAHLARLLTIAMAQRQRQANTLANQLGSDSQAVAEIRAEVATINSEITRLVHEAAASPKLQRNK